MNISMAEYIITHTSGGTLVVVDSLGKLLITQTYAYFQNVQGYAIIGVDFIILKWLEIKDVVPWYSALNLLPLSRINTFNIVCLAIGT
jgi:hypothetical protein